MEYLDDLIWTVADYLRAWGFEVPEEVKQRDAREPGRRQKIMLENKFYRATRAYFNRLAAKAQRRLEMHEIFYPRKAINLDEYIGTDFFEDDEYDADVIRLLLQGVGEGADLFSQQVNIPLDYSGINKKTLTWAKKHAGRLVKDIDATTRPILKDAIRLFVETPGFTIGDIMGMLTTAPVAPLTPERALRVAVTETTRAYSKGNQIGAEQLKAEFPDVLVVETWFTNNDDLVCVLCGPLEGKEVEQGEGFYSPDDSGYEDGYPPRHVNCLPGDTLVLPIGRIAGGSERWYEGDIVIIETLENKLTVTPNHPILTPGGWVAAGLLHEGDKVLSYDPGEWVKLMVNVNDENSIITIKDIFSSLDVNGLRVPTSTPDFHGDGAGSNIAVIRPNSKVMNHRHIHFMEPARQSNLIGRDVVLETAFTSLGAETQLIEGGLSSPASIVSGFDLASALLGGHLLPFDGFGLGLITGGDPSFQNTEPESASIDSGFFGKLILTLSGNVSAQEIVKIGNIKFSGHVYNLQTESGYYVAAGIITHNCRCWTSYTTRIGG